MLHNDNKNIPTPAFAHRYAVRLPFMNAIRSEVAIFLSPLQNDFVAPFDENSNKLLAFYLYADVRKAINSSRIHFARGLLIELPIFCLSNAMGTKHFSEEVDQPQPDQGQNKQAGQSGQSRRAWYPGRAGRGGRRDAQQTRNPPARRKRFGLCVCFNTYEIGQKLKTIFTDFLHPVGTDLTPICLFPGGLRIL